MKSEHKEMMKARRRNIKLTLSYDGTNYHGFQRQTKVVAVQNVLEGALFKLFGDSIELAAAGRTDAGVHAIGQVENGKIIIRSHGVGPSIYDAIKAKGLELADATCPHVKKAQMSAKTLADEGFKVIIIGEKNHPEVKSIKEWAGKNSLVIGSQEEAENIAFVSKLVIEF